jgi:hypothetical protein
MQSIGIPENVNWNFMHEADSGEPMYSDSFESANFLSTSVSYQSGQSFGAPSNLSDDSSYTDSSFFDDWFSAPTPANTMNGRDFMNEVFDDLEIGNVERDASDEE